MANAPAYADAGNYPGRLDPSNGYVQDPNALIQQILSQQAPDFNAQAAAAVAGIYGPQYQALSNLQGNTQARAAQSDAVLQSMYNALAGDIYGQSGGINQNYAAEKAALNNAYNTGQQQIGANYSNANNEVAGLMSKLGIQAAAADPRTLQQNAQQGAFLQSLLAASNTGAQQGASAQNKSSLDYNTAQGNASKAAGANARWENQKALQNALLNYNNQALQIKSAENQAALGLAGQYASTWMGQQQKMADMIYQSYKDQVDNETKLKIAQMQSMPNQYEQYRMMGPMDKSYGEAARLFGANDNTASNAVNLALSVNPNNVRNPFEYIQAVLASKNANADPSIKAIPDDQMRTLAGFIWNELNPQSQPSYGQGYNYP